MLHITSLWSFFFACISIYFRYPCINMAYCCWIGALDIYIRDLLRTTEPGLAFAGRLLFFFLLPFWHVTTLHVALFLLLFFFVFVFLHGVCNNPRSSL